MNDNKNKYNNTKKNSDSGILSDIWKVIKIIFNGIYQFFYSIKFIFSIPLLSLAASIFTFCFIIFVKPFINFLPDFLNNGFLETFIAAGIFVGLKFLLYNDKLQHDYEFEHYQYLISFAFTIIIWIIPIFFMRSEAFNINAYISEGQSYSFESILFIIFYSPHLWLSTITNEIVFSTAFNLIINCALFIGIAMYITRSLYKSVEDDE